MAEQSQQDSSGYTEGLITCVTSPSAEKAGPYPPPPDEPFVINEHDTANLVRDILRDLGYKSPDNDINVEEQKSNIADIARLLKNGGKSGAGGQGCPEFIISSPSTPDFVIIIECKALGKYHESPHRTKPVEYAVDGAIHYGRLLSRGYNVVAVAVSGQTSKALKVSTIIFSKGSDSYADLKNKFDEDVNQLIPFEDFVRLASYDPQVNRSRHKDLMKFSHELHDFMREHAKLTESDKPLLVSGTLIGLNNKAFEKSFSDYSPEDLQKHWLRVIREEIEKADIPNAKKNIMVQPYSNIAFLPELGKSTSVFPKGVLHKLISMLHEKVWRFSLVYEDFDVVGQFYGEFLKYTGGDKKALGIVLTPRHITELFALLANIKKDSKVLDICAGTGGFLISSMYQMLRQAVTDKERTYIRKHCLIGVEQQPKMYALAASNMILRGDGKANLYQGSCFDAAITKAVRDHRCNVGMINPPYSQEDESLQELKFVQHMLHCLDKGGTGIAIVPMSCAIAPHPVREELLRYHTLEAVMSMPDELFYPVGVITCIMVFTAHVPHSTSKRKTWFGYWKSDGFIKTKHKGRINADEKWASIRDRWVEQFRNREVHAGECVAEHVTHKDEWCAEAYMETDYSSLRKQNFERVIRDYARFQLDASVPMQDGDIPNTSKWKPFELQEIFDIQKGKRLTKANMTDGPTPFIGAIDNNNGLSAFVGQPAIHKGNTLTVNYNGGVAEAFYQPKPFWCSDDVNVLYPKFALTPALALFIATVIRLERYRFNYGRKWHLERMRSAVIRLPNKSDGTPDWDLMELYIRSLPFSNQIGQTA